MSLGTDGDEMVASAVRRLAWSVDVLAFAVGVQCLIRIIEAVSG